MVMANFKVTDVCVYGMKESMLASGFPMQTELDYDVENLNYWCDNGLEEIMQVLARNKQVEHPYHRRVPNDIKLVDDHAVLVTRDNDGEITGEFLIDCDDILSLSKLKFTRSGGYAHNSISQQLLHRVITGAKPGDVVDHINGNTLDNRKGNLRITDNKNNCRNNKGKGVSFRADRNKWRAYITVDRKQISLGLFDTEEEALVARKGGELEYYGEYSKSYASERDTNPYNLKHAMKCFKRMELLASCSPGSGHDSALKGITVQMNITAPIYWWAQWDRYHFQDTISSQSTMHRILEMDIEKQCNEYTDPRVIEIVMGLIGEYKELKAVGADKTVLEDMFQKIISTTPRGLCLTRRVTTNYLQLKSMDIQRRGHKLVEWRQFFQQLLPQLQYPYWITGKKLEER